MSAAGTGRVGRPAGKDPETLAKGREFLALTEYGISADAIAQRSGLSRSYVYHALSLARAANGQPAAVDAPPPRPPRKLSEGQVLSRAYDAIRNVRAFKGLLDAETREFWVECLIEIRALADDGINLTFGGQGDIYTSRAEFLSVFGLSDGHLDKLFRHAMLVDLEGAGVAMPYRWNLRGKPAGRRHAARPVTERLLPFPFGVVEGGLPKSDETRISSDSESDEIGVSLDSESDETRISSDSAGVARIAAAAAKSKLNQSTCSSSSFFSGAARESDEIAGESDEIIPRKSDEITSKRSPAGALAADLAAMAMIDRPANPDEIGRVQAWLDAGLAPDFLRAVVDGVMQRPAGDPIVSLKYFDRPIRDARQSAAKAAAPVTSPPLAAPPARPPSPDDALRRTLDASWKRWTGGARPGPIPPTFQAFKAHCDGGAREAAARRWLLTFEAWWGDGRPADGCPPDFTAYMRDPMAMEDEMAFCEDVLTLPGPAIPAGE